MVFIGKFIECDFELLYFIVKGFFIVDDILGCIFGDLMMGERSFFV